MTDDRSLERAARSWLEEGPTRAPDRPVEAALDRIQRTPQQRGLLIPWRLPTMFTNRVAIAALTAVLVVAAGGFALSQVTSHGPGGPGRTPAPTPTLAPTPAPTVTPAPTPIPLRMSRAPGALSPGTYRVEEFAVPFTVTLGSGWIDQGFTRFDFSLPGESAFLALVVMDKVYSDPCHPGAEAIAIEPGVDGLLSALSTMDGFRVEEVRDASVGGLPAKSFTLSNDIDLQADRCARTDVVWIGRNGADQPVLETAGGADELWAVDVSGTTILIGGPSDVVSTISFDR